MGKSFLLLCFLLLSIASCKKEDAATETDILFAKWKLEKTTGTISGSGIDTDWNILELSADEANFYKDNTLISKGSYEMNANKSELTFLFGELLANVMDIRLDPVKQIIMDGKEKLLLNSDCCDRVNYELRRQ